jgi:hypothetical protein
MAHALKSPVWLLAMIFKCPTEILQLAYDSRPRPVTTQYGSNSHLPIQSDGDIVEQCFLLARIWICALICDRLDATRGDIRKSLDILGLCDQR